VSSKKRDSFKLVSHSQSIESIVSNILYQCDFNELICRHRVGLAEFPPTQQKIKTLNKM